MQAGDACYELEILFCHLTKHSTEMSDQDYSNLGYVPDTCKGKDAKANTLDLFVFIS